jgi:hypothetical protein
MSSKSNTGNNNEESSCLYVINRPKTSNTYKYNIVANASVSIPPHASNTLASSNHTLTTETIVHYGDIRNGPQDPDFNADAKKSEGEGSERDDKTSTALVSPNKPRTPTNTYMYKNIVKQLDWLESDDDSTISNTSVHSVYADVNSVLNLFSDLQVSDPDAAQGKAAEIKSSASADSVMPTTPKPSTRLREREGSDFTPPNTKDPRLGSPAS